MKLPQYITNEEVRKVCKELGIRDWTKLKDPKARTKEYEINSKSGKYGKDAH